MSTIKDHTPKCGNPYEILSIPITATTSQIKDAFKELALKLHPDKRSQASKNDKELDRKFIQVKEAKSFLLDAEHSIERKKFVTHLENEIMRREHDERRDKSMGEKRRKRKDDLDKKLKKEEEKKRFRRSETNGMSSTRGDFNNVEGLRKAGQKMREAFGERLANKEMMSAKAMRRKQKEELENRQIRLKWSRKNSYSEHGITKLLSTHGEVEEVELVGKKGNGALVTFQIASSCKSCVDSYLNSDVMRASFVGKRKDEENDYISEPTIRLDEGRERESLEGRKLRQAAERERLLREMEDEGSNVGVTIPKPSVDLPDDAFCRNRMSTPTKTMNKKSVFPPKLPPRTEDDTRKLTALERLEEMERIILEGLICPSLLRKIQITKQKAT